MKVYMIRNLQTAEWFSGYKKSPYKLWTPKQDKGSLWQHKSGPIKAMKHHKLDSSIAIIVTFELTEIE